jgi:3-phenylpropionate/trans-cinnamate dioxygenase ferredoxin subunit
MTELTAGAFRTLAPSTAIANTSVVPFYLSDEKLRVSVARLDGRLYAFDDLCACGAYSCPLSGGLLSERTVMCQCHGSRFDVMTGAVVDGPAVNGLTLHKVKEAHRDIQLRI